MFKLVILQLIYSVKLLILFKTIYWPKNLSCMYDRKTTKLYTFYNTNNLVFIFEDVER